MNERQAYALAHPLNNAQDAARAHRDPVLTVLRRHPSGFKVQTVLAVDR